MLKNAGRGVGMLLGLTYWARPAPAQPPEAHESRPRSAPVEERCTIGTAYDSTVQEVIRQVFGPRHTRTAIRVAQCESRNKGTSAVKGQFRGLFQMGKPERRRYGHGHCAEQQARAAYRYFVAEHRRWRAWKPCLRKH